MFNKYEYIHCSKFFFLVLKLFSFCSRQILEAASTIYHITMTYFYWSSICFRLFGNRDGFGQIGNYLSCNNMVIWKFHKPTIEVVTAYNCCLVTWLCVQNTHYFVILCLILKILDCKCSLGIFTFKFGKSKD